MNKLLTLLLLSSCASRFDGHYPKVEDIDVKQSIDDFLDDCGHRVSTFSWHNLKSVKVEKIDDEDTIGICYRDLDLDGFEYSIIIDPWAAKRPSLLKVLVYHELGHCLMGLSHTDNSMDIMYPTISSNTDIYYKRWKSAVEDLCP